MADLDLLGVVGYEHAHRDAAALGLGSVFDDFDATKRSHGVLSAAGAELLHHATQANFHRLYREMLHTSVDYLDSSV